MMEHLIPSLLCQEYGTKDLGTYTAAPVLIQVSIPWSHIPEIVAISCTSEMLQRSTRQEFDPSKVKSRVMIVERRYAAA